MGGLLNKTFLTEHDLSLFLLQYLRACFVLLVETKLAWLLTRGFRASRLCRYNLLHPIMTWILATSIMMILILIGRTDRARVRAYENIIFCSYCSLCIGSSLHSLPPYPMAWITNSWLYNYSYAEKPYYTSISGVSLDTSLCAILRGGDSQETLALHLVPGGSREVRTYV